MIRKYIEAESARYEKLSKEMADDRTPDLEGLDDIFLWSLQQM